MYPTDCTPSLRDLKRDICGAKVDALRKEFLKLIPQRLQWEDIVTSYGKNQRKKTRTSTRACSALLIREKTWKEPVIRPSHKFNSDVLQILIVKI